MKNNFDSVAWCYDGLSKLVFGNKLKQSQLILLEHIREGDRLLIIGGGTGWILEELLKFIKVKEIDYLERSANMLVRARKRMAGFSGTKVNFIQGDQTNIPCRDKYDAVIACYFFDLFSEQSIASVIPVLKNALKEKGRLLVADFFLSERSHFRHKVLIRMMYIFFKMTSNIEAYKLGPFREMLGKDFDERFSYTLEDGFILSQVYEKK